MSSRKVRCFFCGNLAAPSPTKDDIFVAEKLSIGKKRGCICSECIEYLYDRYEEFFPEGNAFDAALSVFSDANSEKSPKKVSSYTTQALTVFEPREKYPCLSYSITSISNVVGKNILGQEDALKKVVYTIYHNQMANLLEDLGSPAPPHEHLLLIGPTGVGKTFLSTSVLNFMQITYAKSDATAITSAGYIGDKVEDILSRLYHASDCNLEKAQNGVVIIDEIDKKRTTESNTKDVNGLSVQQELLKILEPSTVWIEKNTIPFNTSHLTVILCGAFIDLKDIVNKRMNKHVIGFSSASAPTGDPLSYIEPNDFVSFGFIEEFVGRMPNPIVLSPLSRETIIDIIYLYLNEQNTLFGAKGFELIIDGLVINKIADRVISHNTGARDIKKEISSLLYHAKYKVLESPPGGGICEIDEYGNTSVLINCKNSKNVEVLTFPGESYLQED